MVDKKTKIEVFTAGCSVCDSTVKLVRELACPNCDIHVHDLNQGCETGECRDEAQKYGLKTIPTVVVNGKVVSCCDNPGPNQEELVRAGIGVAL